MKIVPKEIEGLDFFIVLVLSNKEDSTINGKIKDTLLQWCTNAIDGEFGGNMHYNHSLDYNKERNVVYALIDMGTMNPKKGFDALSSICDGVNEEAGRKVIDHIEIDGTVETFNILNPD